MKVVIAADVTGALSGIDKTNTALGSLAKSSDVAAGGSDRLAAAIGRIGHYGLAGGSIYGLSSAIQTAAQAMFSASAEAERLNTQLEFATGTPRQEMAFLGELTQRLGLEFVGTAKAFAGFAAAARGTSMEGQNARATFEAIAKASAVMGLSADETRGALLAVQQMMSKGVVSAEEFRGQLGERMPIALQAGANALGITAAEFSKLMESGKLVSEDFLPKFAAAITEMLGDAPEKAANRLDASVTRMENAWRSLKQAAGDSGVSRMLAADANSMADAMATVAEAMNGAAERGSGAFGQLADATGVLIGRTVLGGLASVAEAVNYSINTLSGGVVNLSTNIDLLPPNLKTAAQQFVESERKIKAARDEYDALASRLAIAPDNIYIKSDMARLQAYIEKLKEARGQAALLSGQALPENYGNEGRGAVQRKATDDAELNAARERAKAYAEIFTKYATPAEKMRTEIEAAKSALGELFTPEVEARIRTKFAGATKPEPGVDRSAVMAALHAEAAKESGERQKLAEQEARATDVMALSVHGLTKAYAQRNTVAGEALLSQAERDLAQALREVSERAEQARESLAQKAASMGDNAAVQVEYRRQLAAVNAAEAAQATSEKKNHEARLARQGDWTTGATSALKSYQSQAENVAGQTEQVFSRAFQGMEDSLVAFAQTGKLSFSSLANSILMDILRIQIRAAMSQATSGLSGWLGGLFGKSTASTATASTTPGFSAGDLGGGIKLAAGGVISGSPSLHQYANTVQTSPKVFAFDKLHGFAKGGVFAEAGPEAVMPLGRDSSGRLGVRVTDAEGGGTPSVAINLYNQSGQQLQAKQQGGPQFDGEKWVIGVVVSAMQSNPAFRQAMRG